MPTITATPTLIVAPSTSLGSTTPTGSTAVAVVTMDLWVPDSLPQLTDVTTLRVRDMAYTRGGTIAATLTALRDEEKMGVFGRLDVRTNRAFTTEPLKPGMLLVNPAPAVAPDTQPEAWLVLTHSDVITGQTRLRTLLRHQAVLPPDVAAAY